jgi:hypothetical protein
MIRKLLAVAAVAAVAALAVGAGRASATVSGLTTEVIVKSASQVGTCTAGLATYNITADVKVHNTSGSPFTLAAIDYAAHAFNSTNTPIGTLVVVVNSAGGLSLPLSVNNGDTTFSNATFTVTGVPCSAIPANNTDRAELCLQLTVLGGAQTDQACSNFISGGTVIPAGTIGMIGFAGLLAVALMVMGLIWRRKQRAGAPVK